MGAWSTEILGDDFASDIYGEFMDAFDGGRDPATIRQQLENANTRAINDPDDGPVFWLARGAPFFNPSRSDTS